jgi:uncharacterized membrane protein
MGETMQSPSRFFFTVFMALGGSANAYAADSLLSICNHNTDRVVYAAHMRQAGGGAGWQSNGWFKIAAGQCLEQNFKAYAGKVFLYAQDEFQESSWGEGSVEFCVKDGAAFTINNADTAGCSGSGLRKVSSDSLTIGPGKTTWDLRPNFSKLELCNRNPDRAVYAAIARPSPERYRSQGWFEILANQCRTFSIGKYTGPVSYFAKSGPLAWEGTTAPFCVNATLAFNLENADLPSACATTGLEMVRPREAQVVTGTTTVEIEPKQLATTLRLCNTTDKVLHSSRATLENALWRSVGWAVLQPAECADIDLGSYTGSVMLYGEWNQGEMYWGNGPFNFCVHRTQAFDFEDSANEAACNSDIALKRVPAFDFPVRPGVNTFQFQP